MPRAKTGAYDEDDYDDGYGDEWYEEEWTPQQQKEWEQQQQKEWEQQQQQKQRQPPAPHRDEPSVPPGLAAAPCGWSCPRCTYMEEATRQTCSMCGAEQPEPVQPEPAPAAVTVRVLLQLIAVLECLLACRLPKPSSPKPSSLKLSSRKPKLQQQTRHRCVHGNYESTSTTHWQYHTASPHRADASNTHLPGTI